jgi:hypothetical protein
MLLGAMANTHPVSRRHNPALPAPLMTAARAHWRAALASASNGDTINATGVSGTIVLTSGETGGIQQRVYPWPRPGQLGRRWQRCQPGVSHHPGHTVQISGLTVTHGVTSFGNGGGILSDQSTLTVSNCTVSGNSASSFGGGIRLRRWPQQHDPDGS